MERCKSRTSRSADRTTRLSSSISALFQFLLARASTVPSKLVYRRLVRRVSKKSAGEETGQNKDKFRYVRRLSSAKEFFVGSLAFFFLPSSWEKTNPSFPSAQLIRGMCSDPFDRRGTPLDSLSSPHRRGPEFQIPCSTAYIISRV